jgi:peptide chain release factor subunit 1
MDGNGTLFGTLCGNTREVLHKFSVDLPKKHGRGGQSALRFARLRMEKRHNYVRKVSQGMGGVVGGACVGRGEAVPG